jgi:hypothetical protein
VSEAIGLRLSAGVLSCKIRQHSIGDIDIAINRLLATTSYVLLGVLIAGAGG